MAEDKDEQGQDDLVPRDELKKVISQRDEAKKQYRDLQTRITEMETRSLTDDDLALFEELKKERTQREEDEEVKRGEFEEVRKRDRESHKKELDRIKADFAEKEAALTKEKAGLLSMLDNAQIHGGIKESAMAHGIINTDDVKYLDQFVQLTAGKVRRTIDDETGEHRLEVLDETGEPRYNSDTAKLLTIPEYVEEVAKANPHFRPNTTGSGPRLSGRMTSRTGNVDYFQRSAIDNLSSLYKDNN